MITKKQLIFWSIFRDALNWMLVGQIPGLCQVLDIPLLVMHYKYAGAKASFTLLELIPTAGFIPIFSIAAFCYSDAEYPAPPPTPMSAPTCAVDTRQLSSGLTAMVAPPSLQSPSAAELDYDDVVGAKRTIVARNVCRGVRLCRWETDSDPGYDAADGACCVSGTRYEFGATEAL